MLTIDATDPKSGTAEFKATAIRVEKLNGGTHQAAVRRQPRGLTSSVDVRLLHAEPTDGRARRGRRVPRSARVAIGRVLTGVEDGHSAHGGHAARAQRHLLLPALQRCRRASAGSARAALNYIARRLTIPPADVYGVATFYALLSVEPRPPRVLHVCDDVVCRCKGSESLIAMLDEQHRTRTGPIDDGATWLPSPCLGQCDRARRRCSIESGEDRDRAVELTRRRAASDLLEVMDGATPAPPPPASAAGGRAGSAAAGAGSASSIPRASMTIAPTAATRRCGGRSRSGPRA